MRFNLTATATGMLDGRFAAFDGKSGNLLWQYDTGAVIEQRWGSLVFGLRYRESNFVRRPQGHQSSGRRVCGGPLVGRESQAMTDEEVGEMTLARAEPRTSRTISE